MNDQLLSNENNLSMLINTDKIRSSIKRLFRNDINEVLGELFQNSQRARATSVEISTFQGGFTYWDNGHGLLDGTKGFHTLLKIAESNFDNPTLIDQDPMGIGINSLLGHDQIISVTISSGSIELFIDTSRWWKDKEYYSTWFNRLTSLNESVKGFKITVTCKEEIIGKLEEALKPKDGKVDSYKPTKPYENCGPAQGYEDILTISFNGNAVDTQLPKWAVIRRPIIETTYQGAKLQIGLNNYYRGCSSILWYGQLIEVDDIGHFAFHLKVDSGRPINPLSPSRQGVIKDDAYKALWKFIIDQLFSFIFDTKNRNCIDPLLVIACFKLDTQRALKESPYYVASSLLPLDPLDTHNFEYLDLKGDKKLFLYEEDSLLLDDGIILKLEDKTTEADNGKSSFLSMIGNAYEFSYGDIARVKIGKLWWRPEGKATHDWFYKPGIWGISYNDKEPTTWNDVTNLPVFAFTETSSGSVEEVDFTVAATDIIDFLHNQAWYAFAHCEESDYEPQQQSYEDSIYQLIRKIKGNCIPHNFSYQDLLSFSPDSALTKIEFSYRNDKQGKSLNHLSIFNHSGEEVKLTFY
jgi:hypothetical protein